MRDREVRHASDPGRSRTWFEWPGGVPVHVPAPTDVNPLRSRRLLVLGLIAGALPAALLWQRSSPVSAPITAVGARWNVDLASAGGRPVTAIVFGREAGVHVVRLPAAGAGEEERTRVSARLANGDVYMVSLGREVLSVHSRSPAGAAPIAFTARGRFVKLYHTSQATGIRTGWW